MIVMACAVGDTLLEGSVVLRIHGGKDKLAEKDLMGAVHLAAGRTYEQDPKYPIRLLVDIAIKALSPAINDPTTAVQAIDQIEDLLRRLARHNLDAGFARDPDGVLRVVVPMPTWDDYLTLAFDEIRQFGMSSVQVIRRLRAALTGLAGSTTIAAYARRRGDISNTSMWSSSVRLSIPRTRSRRCKRTRKGLVSPGSGLTLYSHRCRRGTPERSLLEHILTFRQGSVLRIGGAFGPVNRRAARPSSWTCG